MTKTEALYNFFNSFSIPAYPTSAVPGKAKFPFMTYEVALGEWQDTTAIAVNVYYYTDSEAIINNKVEEISKAIGLGGTQIACDEGAIWITKGSPYVNAIRYDDEPTIKRRQLNLNLTFFTL